MMKRVLAVAICLGLFPGLAFAQAPDVHSQIKLTPSAPAFPAIGSVFFQAPDWQSEYNAAMARKAAGKRKILLGTGIFAGGLALALFAPEPSVNDCVNDIINGDDCGGGWSTMVKLGALAQLTGAGISGWGIFQYHDANNDMRALEIRRPTTKLNGASLPLSENQALRISLGTKSSVGYSVSW
jgi:hypothetical protein